MPQVFLGVIARRPTPPQQRHHPGGGSLRQPGQLEVQDVPAAQQLMRQLTQQPATLGHPAQRAKCRRRRHRHDHRLGKRAVGHGGQAGSGDRAPVVADDHIALGATGSRAHPQGVVHQRTDVIAAVGRNRRRRITTHERRHDVPAGLGQPGCDLAPPVGGIRKAVQAQRNWRAGRPPGQGFQVAVGTLHVNPVWFSHCRPPC
ncbi:Uncharacterised protein [Mycobacterium tuberculosis]|uniref:Uncharacterized protein n=1 Tax=Mycobacterium tuberculosis TaxID=1773 RepID=A0A655F217_MYCTX|nr:Uncharacterised protein [Mycobacterium tuberculosis]CKS25113.1 Uncharacterised protein [Mycobacterium tuberculosis]CNV23360.1 Uncharacterised protein [Mycobacterium tuberculosis]CNV45050.1 Uncharacterised protein [Mycobacterium tuberculosis]